MYPANRIKQWYFYCAECEQKTKAVLYFRTWCDCKESTVMATVDSIEYMGCAVSPEDWEQPEAKNEVCIINPTNIDWVRRNR